MSKTKMKKTVITMNENIVDRRPTTRLSKEVLDAMGPTLEQVMAEEFDTPTIAAVRRRAAAKTELIMTSRAQAATMSASIGILKALRKAAGVSQVEMARRMKVSPPAISQMETSDPQMSSVLLYAEALGKSLALTIIGPEGASSLPLAPPVDLPRHRATGIPKKLTLA